MNATDLVKQQKSSAEAVFRGDRNLYQEKQCAELAPLPDGVAPVVLPEDRARNMTAKTGFSYFLVTMNFYEGAKVGLYLKHFRNQVIVSRTEEASLAGESLQMLDRIVDVDGIPVSDKDVCKTLIVRALHATGSVSMLVERPVDEAAKDLMTSDSGSKESRSSSSEQVTKTESPQSGKGSTNEQLSKEGSAEQSRSSAEQSPPSKEGSAEQPQRKAYSEQSPVLPAERQKNFNVRPGYSYFLVSIPFVQGTRFGLGVKHYRKQVIVSKVEPGSTSSGTLQVLDRICDVNAVPVTDKDVCKNMIIQSLQTYGEVNMIVERPVESYAVEAMERKALTDPTKPRTDSNPNAPRLTFQEGPQKSHISLIIGCDRTPSQQAQLKVSVVVLSVFEMQTFEKCFRITFEHIWCISEST
ncbi:unnamed protein product [Nippostrongylus brasiliensis]|uniref:PDZ domain-containing protein n=1 Tax=Nippostrongylus brasiliensis TaxID=27835 RepID=A0A0N4YRC1_NIPBR|nr:unnamed protein product [Nippostrongylus brasiliensis]